MQNRPKLDIIYLLSFIGIVYLTTRHNHLSVYTLIDHLVLYDIFIGIILILKGLIARDTSYVIAGLISIMCTYSAINDHSTKTLIFLILGGLTGVGNHIRKTTSNIF